MKRFWRISLFLVLTVFLLLALFMVVVNLAGKHASYLVQLATIGQKRVLLAQTKATLSHLASIEEVRRLDEHSCSYMLNDLKQSDGLYAVLALGDSSGNAICTADYDVKPPLPPMSDRLYFQKVKTATDMVIGEYAVSKTTRIPSLHMAYPIRSEKGEFEGFVMAAVNLKWFMQAYDTIEPLRFDLRVMAVDRNGKLLFETPSRGEQPGTEEVSEELLAAMLSGKDHYRFLKGVYGDYRVFAYEPMSADESSIYMVSSVTIWPYIQFIAIIMLVACIYIKFATSFLRRR